MSFAFFGIPRCGSFFGTRLADVLAFVAILGALLVSQAYHLYTLDKVIAALIKQVGDWLSPCGNDVRLIPLCYLCLTSILRGFWNRALLL